ncbi:aminoacyl-histidine dipeptidase [Marispirochaeta aestuarii]|uniref:aminoacyl-histidine dipeptidase n=1 Tax=Marispirochaeta aestuarii TaxID=1963862 RepID=UPI0029C80766|nr:aminoacyl-histidine dipeptidase [Marispirochaeta aestuarii]
MAVLNEGAGCTAPLWKFFEEMLAIPHGSGNEAALAQYIRSFAQERKLPVRIDSAGNVIIKKPASPGYEDHPPVVLQGHIDMVCEKNDGTVHDFEQDPIRPVIDGDWLRADGTTLGADNGIGVAAALAVLDDPDLKHPSLEALFTVDEETGLNGAMAITPDLIEGRRLINLDSEEEGVFYFGCAGGRNTSGSLVPSFASPRSGSRMLRLRVEGLSGGHSGGEIHRRLGNALQLGALAICSAEAESMEIVSLRGGGKHNAIPREAEFILALAPGDIPRLKEAAAKVESDARGLYTEDKPVRVVVEELKEKPSRVLKDGIRIIRGLLAMPHGSQEMSTVVPGMVETSTNLAAVTMDDKKLYVLTSQRSAAGYKRDIISRRVKAQLELMGCTVEYESEYPSWEPNPDSPLLRFAAEVYREARKKEPHLTAVHAGLECGVIADKVPGMDMVSFGPDLEGAHSPDERVSIPSTEAFWSFLKELLARL